MIKVLIFVSLVFLFFLIYALSKNLEKKTVILIYIIIASLVLVLSFYFVSIKNDKSDKSYVPPKFDGERIVLGHFHEKD